MDYCLWLSGAHISTCHYFSVLRFPTGVSLSLGGALSAAWALSVPGPPEICSLASAESHPLNWLLVTDINEHMGTVVIEFQMNTCFVNC